LYSVSQPEGETGRGQGGEGELQAPEDTDLAADAKEGETDPRPQRESRTEVDAYVAFDARADVSGRVPTLESDRGADSTRRVQLSGQAEDSHVLGNPDVPGFRGRGGAGAGDIGDAQV
jgi:hypothetical protein